MDQEWEIINDNNYLSSSEDEFVLLLDIENGRAKTERKETEPENKKSLSDKKILFMSRERKRPRRRSHSCMNFNKFNHVNYVVSGSSFLEPYGTKRLKLRKENFLLINVASDINLEGSSKLTHKAKLLEGSKTQSVALSCSSFSYDKNTNILQRNRVTFNRYNTMCIIAFCIALAIFYYF
jgi:hypothetical protein